MTTLTVLVELGLFVKQSNTGLLDKKRRLLCLILTIHVADRFEKLRRQKRHTEVCC